VLAKSQVQSLVLPKIKKKKKKGKEKGEEGRGWEEFSILTCACVA
jgi:hypothetical protein